MGEHIGRSDMEDTYSRTHHEFNNLTGAFEKGPALEHRSRVQISREQAGLEIRSMVQGFVERVRGELPQEVRIDYGTLSVDLNLDRWTFFFAGAEREVDSAHFGEFWFENRGAITSAIERTLLTSRGVFLA